MLGAGSAASIWVPQIEALAALISDQTSSCAVLQINRDGTVEHLPESENFPDTKAAVLGREIGTMPDTLTT